MPRIARGLVKALTVQLNQGVTSPLIELAGELMRRCRLETVPPGHRLSLAEAMLGVGDGPVPTPGRIEGLPYDAPHLATRLLDGVLRERAALTPEQGLRLSQWVGRTDASRASRLAAAFLAMGPRDPDVTDALQQLVYRDAPAVPRLAPDTGENVAARRAFNRRRSQAPQDRVRFTSSFPDMVEPLDRAGSGPNCPTVTRVGTSLITLSTASWRNTSFPCLREQ